MISDMIKTSLKYGNRLIMIFLSILGIAACKNHNTPWEEIPIINLTSESLLKDTAIFMKYPYKIRVMDSIMCIWDLHGGDKFFHIFSYPELKFITSFGESGRGDREFVNTAGFRMDEQNIYVFDSYRAKLNIFSIDSIMHNKLSPFQVINYPATCVPVLSFAKMENGYALLNFNGDERISFVDTLGQIIAKKYKYPITDTVEFKRYRAFTATLWDSFIDYNSHNKILGIVTKLGNVLEIYNLTNDSCKVIIGPGGTPGMFKKGGSVSVGKIEGFSDIQIKLNSIYTLYSGLKREDIYALRDKGIRSPNGGNFIYEYNLQGKLKKIYKLDRYVDGFDLHENEGIIYTVSSNDENSVNKYHI